MIIRALITGNILIDIGNSAKIIFKFVFERMDLSSLKLAHTTGPLYGFSGEEAEVMIPLGEGKKQFIVMANFIIVDSLAIIFSLFDI